MVPVTTGRLMMKDRKAQEILNKEFAPQAIVPVKESKQIIEV